MYQNKKVFILGMAKSGYECAKLLATENEVFITDSKAQDEKHIKELEAQHVIFKQSENPIEYFDNSYDVVVKNPGILMTHPVIQKAIENHIPVVNEMEVAYHYLPEKRTIIGVTGSNGKTTTTTLIYEMLKEAKLPVHLGGNIGYPLSSIVKHVKENDIVLLEISDHQLKNFKDFKTDISVLTNLSPTHLDFHGTYEEYKKTKMKIFDHHTSHDIAIINALNEESMNETLAISSEKKYFAGKDAYIKEDAIYIKDEKVIELSKLRLKGMHNYENIMACLLVVKEFPVSQDVITKVLTTFKGVEHRIEFVKVKDGISYYNDSKSTNPAATITALKSFNTPVLLILGGFERSQNFHDLKEHLQNVKHIYGIGETRFRIQEFAESYNIPCTIKETLKEVMVEVQKDAKKGDTVLLSPASASWDQYEKFEDRGDEFKGFI